MYIFGNLASLPAHPKGIGLPYMITFGAELDISCNAKKKTVLYLTPTPIPIWVGVWKHDFFYIWTFHLIPSRSLFFWKCTSQEEGLRWLGNFQKSLLLEINEIK